MRKTYVTPFNTVTKQPTGPSTEIPANAVPSFGKPDIVTPNTAIYKEQGLCVSWIRFSVCV